MQSIKLGKIVKQTWQNRASAQWAGLAASLVIICCLIGAVAYFVSGDSTVVSQGQGDDTSLVQKSSGLHILEINAEGMTCEKYGWILIEVICVMLSIGLGLTLTHLGHYCYSKRLFKERLKKALLVQKATLPVNVPEVELEVPPIN